MSYSPPQKNNSTVRMRLICAIVFLVFTFLWTYFFEADELAMALHVYSGGHTIYNKELGTLLWIVMLMILQLLVSHFTRLSTRSYALTYLPSMLLLAMVTSLSELPDGKVDFDFSWWIIVLLLVLWGLLVLFDRLYPDVGEEGGDGLLSRPMWSNLLALSFQIILVAWIGNTDSVFHYRLKIERALLESDVEKALKQGVKSLESDGSLLMLRVYALSRMGELGDRLFCYPVSGTSKLLLPSERGSRLLLYPADSLYRYTQTRRAKIDYLLCGYLIDKRLDNFASEVGKYYEINDSLPRHYREALTLYTHLRSQPVVIYHNSVMDEDYHNLQDLRKRYPLWSEQKQRVRESSYVDTYWYYYEFY